MENSYSDRYELAAKLINKGYLIHCTNADFDEFNKNFIKGGSRAREGYGFYFSDMPYKSIDYGNKMLLVKKGDFNFLPLDTKLDIGSFTKDYEDINCEIARCEEMLYSVRTNREYDMYDNEIKRLKGLLKNFDTTLIQYIRQAIGFGATNYGELQCYINDPETNLPKIAELLIKQGYDGYSYDGIYAIFNIPKLNQKVINYESNKGIEESRLYRVVLESVRKGLYENM